MKRKICFTLAAMLVILSALSAASLDSMLVNNNRALKLGDFDFEVWRNRGDANMTIFSDGTFICTWDREETPNIVYRSGKRFDRSQTHEQVGDITIVFEAEYEATGTSSLCVYGWTDNPVAEFRIVEAWGDNRPAGRDPVEIVINGDTYTVFIESRNGGHPFGNGEYLVFNSVRTTSRRSGEILVSEHFKAWEELGLELGLMHEVSLSVTGFNSTGSATLNKIILSYGDNTIGGVTAPEPAPEPDPEPTSEDEPAEGAINEETPSAGENEDDNEPLGGGAPSEEDGDSGIGLIGLAIGVPVFGAFSGLIVTRKPKKY